VVSVCRDISNRQSVWKAETSHLFSLFLREKHSKTNIQRKKQDGQRKEGKRDMRKGWPSFVLSTKRQFKQWSLEDGTKTKRRAVLEKTVPKQTQTQDRKRHYRSPGSHVTLLGTELELRNREAILSLFFPSVHLSLSRCLLVSCYSFLLCLDDPFIPFLFSVHLTLFCVFVSHQTVISGLFSFSLFIYGLFVFVFSPFPLVILLFPFRKSRRRVIGSEYNCIKREILHHITYLERAKIEEREE